MPVTLASGLTAWSISLEFAEREETDATRLQGTELEPPPAAAALGGVLAAGVIDQDALHGHNRVPHEAAPVRGRRAAETEIGFVYQGRRVRRVPDRLVHELGRGEPTALVVNQREEAAIRERLAHFFSGSGMGVDSLPTGYCLLPTAY